MDAGMDRETEILRDTHIRYNNNTKFGNEINT